MCIIEHFIKIYQLLIITKCKDWRIYSCNGCTWYVLCKVPPLVYDLDLYLMYLTLNLSPNFSQFIVEFINHATSMWFPISWILPKFPRTPRHLRTNCRHIENFQCNHKDSFPSTRYWIEPPVYSLYIPSIHYRLEVMGSFKPLERPRTGLTKEQT